MSRPPLLRALGALVGVCLVAVAVQLLLVSFDADALLSRRATGDVTDWVGRRPSAGAGILSGLALVAVALALGWHLVRSYGPERRVLTARRKDGATRIDRDGLAASFERRLEQLDQRVDVSATVHRDGRVDLELVVPDPSSSGPVHEMREALDAICAERHLPCRSGRIKVRSPRRTTGRHRVR